MKRAVIVKWTPKYNYQKTHINNWNGLFYKTKENNELGSGTYFKYHRIEKPKSVPR